MSGQNNARARRILIVEDDDGMRGLVARHLRRRGFDVREARDAETVLLKELPVGLLDPSPFDLILTDVHLPRLTGLELVRLVTSRWPMQQVVLITGDADGALAREALSRGAAGYLLKPFEMFELDAAINPALSRLELLETTRGVAQAAATDDAAPVAGVLPQAWIRMADERSAGGAGHAERVAQICGALTVALSRSVSEADREVVDQAARAHELGRLVSAAASASGAASASLQADVRAAVDLTTRTVQLLTTLGYPADAIAAIRSLQERWDGSGGPKALIGPDIPHTSMIVAVADAVDHAAVANLGHGADARAALNAAVVNVILEDGTRFDPTVVRALRETRVVIEEIWSASVEAAARASASAEPQPEQSGARNQSQPVRIVRHVGR